MENATQALFIAAGVLIGIVILSLAVYLGNMMGGYAANTQEQMDKTDLQEFNNQFLKYNGLSNLTIQDVITVKNYALENNKKLNPNYDYKSSRAESNNDYIDVYYDSLEDTNALVFSKSDEELLKSAIGKILKCEVIMNTATGRVHKINFTEIED